MPSRRRDRSDVLRSVCRALHATARRGAQSDVHRRVISGTRRIEQFRPRSAQRDRSGGRAERDAPGCEQQPARGAGDRARRATARDESVERARDRTRRAVEVQIELSRRGAGLRRGHGAPRARFVRRRTGRSNAFHEARTPEAPSAIASEECSRMRRRAVALFAIVATLPGCTERGIVGITANRAVDRDAAGSSEAATDGALHVDANAAHGVTIDDCRSGSGAGLDRTSRRRSSPGAADASAMRFLYPYDATVYPQGIPGPVLMWDGPLPDVVYVRLHSEHIRLPGLSEAERTEPARAPDRHLGSRGGLRKRRRRIPSPWISRCRRAARSTAPSRSSSSSPRAGFRAPSIT